jgi:hypothetical protein
MEQEVDIVPGTSQFGAIVAADGACSDDCVGHFDCIFVISSAKILDFVHISETLFQKDAECDTKSVTLPSETLPTYDTRPIRITPLCNGEACRQSL